MLPLHIHLIYVVRSIALEERVVHILTVGSLVEHSRDLHEIGNVKGGLPRPCSCPRRPWHSIVSAHSELSGQVPFVL